MKMEVSFPDIRILTAMAACPGDTLGGQPSRACTVWAVFCVFPEDPQHQGGGS